MTDHVEKAGAYIRHRMPELSAGQARDAAMHTLGSLEAAIAAERKETWDSALAIVKQCEKGASDKDNHLVTAGHALSECAAAIRAARDAGK